MLQFFNKHKFKKYNNSINLKYIDIFSIENIDGTITKDIVYWKKKSYIYILQNQSNAGRFKTLGI